MGQSHDVPLCAELSIAGIIYKSAAAQRCYSHAEGTLMNDFTGRIWPDEWQPPVGLKRTLTVALDPAQYQADMTHMAAHRSEDVYSTFNLLMRRKPKVGPLCL